MPILPEISITLVRFPHLLKPSKQHRRRLHVCVWYHVWANVWYAKLMQRTLIFFSVSVRKCVFFFSLSLFLFSFRLLLIFWHFQSHPSRRRVLSFALNNLSVFLARYSCRKKREFVRFSNGPVSLIGRIIARAYKICLLKISHRIVWRTRAACEIMSDGKQH